MAGPFAPTLSEPGTANVQPVQTTLARPAEVGGNLLTDTVTAVGQGFDIFTKWKKAATDRGIDEEIEKLEQATVDKLIDANLRVSDVDSETDDPDEELPAEAQNEMERLDKLREGVKQGVVSNDKMLLNMVAGARKIKALFPAHTGVIDARMMRKFGFRPTTAIIERALAPEKAREARVAAFKDDAFKMGSFSMRPDGTVGPFLNEDGTTDDAKTIDNGAALIHAANESELLRKASQAKAAALAVDAAKGAADSASRKRALEVDAKTSNAMKASFDNTIDALMGPQMEATLQGLRRVPGGASPAQIEQAMQNMVGIIRQSLDGVRKQYVWPHLNTKTQEDAMAYINPRIEALMDPFTNKDTGFMLQSARLLVAAQNATKFRLSKFPKLFAYMQMGRFGAEIAKFLMFKDPKLLAGLLDNVKELGQELDESAIIDVTKKLISSSDAIVRLTPTEAVVGLTLLREGTAKWARDKSLAMDDGSATGYFNAMHNLAKSASVLPTSKDKLEAASFFSDTAMIQRVNELATFDEKAAEVIGTDAIYVINEAIAATGRELGKRPGFGDTWTVEYDNTAGSFVARMTKDFPSISVGEEDRVALGGPDTGLGLDVVARSARDLILSQMDEATDIIFDMNSGLSAVEQYSPLDESLKDLDRLQVREAIAASARLGNVEGTLSNFKTAAKKSSTTISVARRFETVKEALMGGMRSLNRKANTQDKEVLRALQNRSAPSETKVIRMTYDPVTDTFKPTE